MSTVFEWLLSRIRFFLSFLRCSLQNFPSFFLQDLTKIFLRIHSMKIPEFMADFICFTLLLDDEWNICINMAGWLRSLPITRDKICICHNSLQPHSPTSPLVLSIDSCLSSVLGKNATAVFLICHVPRKISIFTCSECQILSRCALLSFWKHRWLPWW